MNEVLSYTNSDTGFGSSPSLSRTIKGSQRTVHSLTNKNETALKFLNSMWKLPWIEYELSKEENTRSLSESKNAIIAVSDIIDTTPYKTAVLHASGSQLHSLLNRSITEIVLPFLRKKGLESVRLMSDDILFTDHEGMYLVVSHHKLGRSI